MPCKLNYTKFDFYKVRKLYTRIDNFTDILRKYYSEICSEG